MDSVVPRPPVSGAVRVRRSGGGSRQAGRGRVRFSKRHGRRGQPPRLNVVLCVGKYREIGGKMSARELGKVMAQRPEGWIRGRITTLNRLIGGTLGEAEVELAARLLQFKGRGYWSRIEKAGPERDGFLAEVRLLAAALESD